MALVPSIIQAGTHAAIPAAASANEGYLYYETDTQKLFRSNGASWVQVASGVTQVFDASAVDVTGTFALSGDISPSQITGNQNDYNPTGLSGASVLRLNSDASRNITGLQGGADGRLITIVNVGSQNIVLKDSDAGSSAANQFALSGDITLAADDGVILQYDSTSSRWRCIGKSPGGAGTGTSKLVQQVSTETGATALGTTTIPIDDTIPQNTEGTEFMTLAITPTSSTNDLYIEVTVIGAPASAAWVIAALFQDTTAGALAAGFQYQGAGDAGTIVTFTHKMAAGTTSSTTFKVRAGAHSGNFRFNGNSGARLLGGVLASSIVISEVIP